MNKNFIRTASFGIVLFFFSLQSRSQQFFRLKADFSVKEVNSEGVIKLTMGTLYYDTNEKKLLMDMKFPQEELLVFYDTLLYLVIDDRVAEKKKIIDNFVTSSLYHLLLKNELSNFGLGSSGYYEKGDITENNGFVVTEWMPSGGLENITGKILTQNQSNKLIAILFYNKEGDLLNRQNFNDYIFIQGLFFPQEVIQQYYKQVESGTVTLTKKYTYKNIILNDTKNNEFYNYTLPDRSTENSGSDQYNH